MVKIFGSVYMKILMIGGTRFVGYHIVKTAIQRGHEMTLFNRGQSNPDAFPNVETITGDRTKPEDLQQLAGRQWDVVIDTCGYVPRITRASAEVLKDAVERYIFISTVSVYADPPPPEGLNEESELATLEDETTEDISGGTYGGLKVLCEKSIEETLPGRTLIIRPGLIVGPQDPTDRFTYWVRRIADGGEVLAPGNPDAPVQFIDVRDLAEWAVDMAEKKATGVYNAVAPTQTITMGEFLETANTFFGNKAHFTWVSEEFLKEKEVGAFSEMPLWIPSEMEGMHKTSNAKAIAEDFTSRPVQDTLHDTLLWFKSLPADSPLLENGVPRSASIKPEREKALLEEWHQRQT
jgi:2'-hydroxyisoflavone reductase